MKNRFLWVLLTFAALNSALAVPDLNPQLQQTQAALLSAEVMSRFHYKHAKLDDALSLRIFDHYLKGMDGEKLFFVQADIDRFSAARTQLDDAIRNQDLSVPYALFTLYQQRVGERFTYARSLLAQGFDFSAQESYPYTRKHAAWATSEAELNDLWRKRVKNDWLRLKLGGKDDAAIRETLAKRYDNALHGLDKIKSEDVFQSFMSAYTNAVDPHTDYFGLRAANDFDISMKLSLMGIGAVLQEKDEYTTIRELVAGGPAALSGKLKVGDRIVGVGQGDKPMVDVIGMRLDDTVALIRGAEDSTVRLSILSSGADGDHKVISLIRKKISLDKQAAQKSVIEVKEGAEKRRIGVITLPGFYLDFAARQRGDKDYKSATRDVAKLLAEFKQDKIDSVLIDLRNNGGGSLDEAIELTGLFISKGPVVQQRDAEGKIKIGSDTNPAIDWAGPMGVLINRGSASASEIFAAAIQDYGRGVVIGETSFGKGTVQSVVNLDQLTSSPQPKYGELKMTIAQFFRINGGTTQLRGVVPDIRLPSLTDEEDFGESSYDNALPWTQIKAADYRPAGDLRALFPKLIARHDKRVSNDQDFRNLQDDIAEIEARRKSNVISLNEDARRKEREVQQAHLKSRSKQPDDAALQDDGLQSSERNLAADIALEKSRKEAKDVLLDEAAHILSDELSLMQGNTQVAASVMVRMH